MRTMNIFKTMALAMLMPAMLLTTACSNEDDAINNGDNKKGYPLQVTVNVTRQGDKATTRATYNDGTKKLGFSAGDKLFVSGSATGTGKFAGALDYVPATGKFSGTIYTQNNYDGTADALFSAAYSRIATLLPNGYDSYNFLSISNNNTPDVAYDDVVSASTENAFVASETAKKTGVEQLSCEQAYTYSSGFALAPTKAVLNFTISGLEAGAKTVTLITKYSGMDDDQNISGSVTPNASGVATFAIGVSNNLVIKNVANNLTVGSSKFTLPGGTALAIGKIYNITRGTGATVNLSTKSTAYTASNGETLTGTLASNVKLSIADGATVILNNVTINGENDSSYGWAGITCLGDATIILSGTNTVKGFYEDHPGIYVPENKTVTIQGTGSLTASSNGWAAGIGGGSTGNCGNITITGGNITATGGSGRAGIGGGSGACGNITITGGTITATGGNNAAGIGGGTAGTCGNITITSGVTRVTATKGNIAPNSIGAGGSAGTCGTVTIGGVVTGNITDSPYTYPAPAPSYTMAANATAGDVGKLICTDGHIHVYGEDAACTAGRVAIIAYVGSAGSVDASSASYKGLAIALSDANGGGDCQWAKAGDGFANCLNGIGGQTDAIATALGFKNGITCTSTLTAVGHSSHNHTAATAAASNNGTAAPTGTSGWFMPSMGQWNLIVQGLATKKAGSAVTTDLKEDIENDTYKANNLNSVITDAGGTGLKADSYWASTEENSVRAWTMDFWNGYATNFAKSVNCYVRSIIAF